MKGKERKRKKKSLSSRLILQYSWQLQPGMDWRIFSPLFSKVTSQFRKIMSWLATFHCDETKITFYSLQREGIIVMIVNFVNDFISWPVYTWFILQFIRGRSDSASLMPKTNSWTVLSGLKGNCNFITLSSISALKVGQVILLQGQWCTYFFDLIKFLFSYFMLLINKAVWMNKLEAWFQTINAIPSYRKKVTVCSL